MYKSPPGVKSQTETAVMVDEIKRIDKGSLRAFATVTVGGRLTIHSIRVIQEGQVAWVSMPQNEVKSQVGGKSKWFPIVEIHEQTLKQQISEAVLAAWRTQS